MNAVATVRKLYLVGEQRWPLVKLSFEVFEAHCQRVFAPEQGVDIEREASDLYLCFACIESEPEALRTLQSEGLGVARAAISRINRDSDFVQEVLQELWGKLLVGSNAKVRQYSGRGPLLGWIRVAAARLAVDRCRSKGVQALREVELTEQIAEHGSNPETFLTKARLGREFQEAVCRAVAALASQDRNVLRMHVNGGCTIDEIGRAYGVHRATAARWLDRSRVRIYDAVRRELCAQDSKLTESEFKSLANLLRSQLELHLSSHSRLSDAQSSHA
jgi:RNA polymerase sigma-70 factor (ECF subfamily)